MSPTYRSELDGLRGIAIALVLLSHTDAAWFSGGQHGVDIFFVLSGYLITRLLPGVSLGEFWWRRMTRLVPALAVLVLAYFALMPVFGWPAKEGWLALTYTRNIALVEGGMGGHLLHTWSLASEAQFYLIWPLILPFIRRPSVLLLLWIALTVARTVFLTTTHDWAGAYFSPIFHSSGLVLGAACALAPRLSGKWGLIGAAALLAPLVAAPMGLPRLAAGTSIIEIATALIILAPTRLTKVLTFKPLVWLGLISYGVYLWHFPVTVIFKDLEWWGQLFFMLLFGLPLGALSYVTVERLRRLPTPSLKWLRGARAEPGDQAARQQA